ncbi:hypothetical protein GCM10018793_65900 [Streptomyces sulfonofaciens]|uniref:Uncharacterized protein n=1 Tax=Streptomyces sulfonofaciens TaxID=68272 RepID=A0A919GPT0_9ACTN|nr:hypothetical protein [Streptomyces sulfonofaciens]GHH87993.1 hypothetical protein GCM10018793_65900 [Streptomyces sulfonofaciens]
MFRRREPIPFAFLADADRFRSNVAPPPRRRASAGELAGRVLLGMTIVAGLVGSVLLGLPALSADQPPAQVHHSEAQQSTDGGR